MCLKTRPQTCVRDCRFIPVHIADFIHHGIAAFGFNNCERLCAAPCLCKFDGFGQFGRLLIDQSQQLVDLSGNLRILPQSLELLVLGCNLGQSGFVRAQLGFVSGEKTAALSGFGVEKRDHNVPRGATKI